MTDNRPKIRRAQVTLTEPQHTYYKALQTTTGTPMGALLRRDITAAVHKMQHSPPHQAVEAVQEIMDIAGHRHHGTKTIQIRLDALTHDYMQLNSLPPTAVLRWHLDKYGHTGHETD